MKPQTGSHGLKPRLCLLRFPWKVSDHFGTTGLLVLMLGFELQTSASMSSSASNVDQVTALCFHLPLPGAPIDREPQNTGIQVCVFTERFVMGSEAAW